MDPFHLAGSGSVSDDPDPGSAPVLSLEAPEVGPPEPDQGRRVRRPPPAQVKRRLPLQELMSLAFLQILLKVYFFV